MTSKKLLIAGAMLALANNAATAGGFDRGGVNIDQLFDKERVSTDFGVTFVLPQRDLNNVVRGSNIDSAFSAAGFPSAAINSGFTVPALAPQTSSRIEVDNDYVVPTAGFKVAIGDHVDCLASYSEPFGADAEYGLNNAFSVSGVNFNIDSNDYGLTCSYKFDAGPGQLRAIAGFSYLELQGTQTRQTLGDLVPVSGGTALVPGAGAGGAPLAIDLPAGAVVVPSAASPTGFAIANTQATSTFALEDEAFGYRVGLAYEIPSIALRASVVYNSAYRLDDLTGFADTTRLAVIPGTLGAVNAASASTEIPQSVEVKLQTGIAEGTLAFGTFKWQQWSKLGIIPISGVISPFSGLPTPISFDPLYRDGFTASLGLGRQFSDLLSGAASIGYDRGTSTITGTQTDTWTFSTGVSFNFTENFEFRVGGVVGLLTDGTSGPSGGDPANDLTYSFGNDVLGAFNLKAKLRF